MPGKHRPPCCRNAIPPPACGKIEKKRENMPKLCVRACKDHPEFRIESCLHARTLVFWFSHIFSLHGKRCTYTGRSDAKKASGEFGAALFGEARLVYRFTFLLRFFSIPLRFIDCIPKTIQLISDNWHSLIACPSYESTQRIY